MKENQVRLDIEISQIADLLFEVMKESWIGAIEVALAALISNEWVKVGFVVVIFVALWKNAHTKLIEGSFLQTVQGVLL